MVKDIAFDSAHHQEFNFPAVIAFEVVSSAPSAPQQFSDQNSETDDGARDGAQGAAGA